MRYAMQSWEGPKEGCDHEDEEPGCPSCEGDHWESMHEDSRPAIAKHWAPTATALAAAIHCYAWTGGIAPAMQVVDLSTGKVVWRSSEGYPAAGPSIPLEEEQLVLAGARAIWKGERQERVVSAQESLF